MKFIYQIIMMLPHGTHETEVTTLEPCWTNDVGFIVFPQGEGKQCTFNPAHIAQMDVTHVAS